MACKIYSGINLFLVSGTAVKYYIGFIYIKIHPFSAAGRAINLLQLVNGL